MSFGQQLQALREARGLSLRAVAERASMAPGYLSRIERDLAPPPSEDILTSLAGVLGMDPDVMVAMTGRMTRAFEEAVRKRPELFVQVIRAIKDAPDNALLRIVREVRDGNW